MIKLIKTEFLGVAVLRLTFPDGPQGDDDFAPLLAKNTALTRPLQAPEYFQSCFLELGALCGKNGLEFNAGSLYRDLRDTGKPSSTRHAA
jgi:hypothetical protein